MSVLRKALGERATGQQYIETVPRVGYRFAAPVETTEPLTEAAVASAVKLRQEIRYCLTDDGVRLAYASIGSGPIVSVRLIPNRLMKVKNFLLFKTAMAILK